MDKEDKINQSQIFDLISGEELSWQTIIYDLIRTEQLDPWDIDIGVLAEKYLDTIKQLEEANFFLSSKVLLACSLLLRLKSEILATKYIQELNEILYGKKETQQALNLENFAVDENELPLLIPKTPMARHKKVTLEELMKALNNAMDTEHRRIKKEIKSKQSEKFILMNLPKTNLIPLKVRIKKIFDIISAYLNDSKNPSIMFHDLAQAKEEKIASFLPILHLTTEQKIFLYQPMHFEDIHITAKMHPNEKKELDEFLEKEIETEITKEDEALAEISAEFNSEN